MSFLSGLGDVFHAIGHFVSGTDGNTNAGTTFDNQQDKKQQQNQPQAPQQTSQPQQSGSDNNPVTGNMINLSPLEKTPSNNPSSLTNYNPTPAQPNSLVKAPTPAQPDNNSGVAGAQDNAPNNNGGGGFFHDITHNGVTNWVGNDIVKPTESAFKGAGQGLARILPGGMNDINAENAQVNQDAQNVQDVINKYKAGQLTKTEEQNLITSNANDASQAGSTLDKTVNNMPTTEQFAGDLAQVGAFMIPGAGEAAPEASLLEKVGMGAAKGAGAGAVFGAGGGMSNNENLPGVIKSGVEGAATGAVAGGALPVIGAGLRKVGSFISGNAAADTADAAVNEADRPPNEVAPGLKGANPDLAVAAQPAPTPPMPTFGDVIKDEVTNPATIAEGSTVAGTAADEIAKAADQRAPTAPTPPPQEPLPTVEFNEGPSVSPGTLPPDTVNASPTALVTKTPTPAPVVDAAGNVVTTPKQLQLVADERGGVQVADKPPVVQSPVEAAAAQQPIQVADPTAPVTVDTTPQTQAPTPAEQVQAAAAQEASQAPTPLIAQAADDAERLKNARFQQTVVDASKNPAMKSALEEAAQNKDTAPLAQLNEQAISNVQNMSLPELVQHYGQDFAEGEKGPIDNPQQLYEHLQALRQLEQLPTDAAAQDAAANALRAINDYANRSGVGTRAMQLAYTDMPTSMKVAYLTKLVQKAGGDFGPGNPDFEHLVAAADLQTKFAQTAQDAENAAHDYSTSANQADPNFNDNMKALLARDQEAQGVLYDQNRNVLNILERNLPKSDLGTRVAQQARTSMLSSIGGRGFAMMSTGVNAAQWLTDNTLSSLFGRAINRVNGDNGVRVSFARPGTLVKGAVNGFKGLARDTFGNSPVESVDKALKGHYDNEYSHDNTRYGFIGNHVTAPLRKIVRFGVGSHMAATAGIRDATLEQSARQAAESADIPKENMQGFVDYYKAHPPQQQADEAKQAWMAANNLHKNGVSDTLSKAAGAIENLGNKAGDGKAAATASFVAKQIRTVFVPFSHYMGGFVDKALTDRNMFYNIGRAATARSPQELSDQLAHLTTNVGTAIGAGYGLAQAGIITNKDQNGKNYDGMYFHIGNRYIPVAIAGQAAMPIIMGATYHDAMHDGSKGGSWPQKVVTAAMQTGDNIMKATGVAGTFGGNSSVNQLLAGNGEAGIPKVVGAAVQQHVPAVTGDINAILNRTSLDPTHEAADTKATTLNNATGRQDTNQVATQVNKTLNEIPGVSQLALPRSAGQEAPSELDRMFHAGETSPSQIQAAQLQKAQLNQDQQDYKNDVPIFKPGKNDVPKGYNFDNTLNSDIQTNKFDKAVAGLQNQLKDMTTPGPEHNPPDKIQAVRDRISQFQLAQKNKWSYDDMKQYNSTSVSAWRDMGNPDKSTYDPTTYQKLWAMDATLAKSGVAGTLGIGDGNSVKASSTQKYNLSTGRSRSGSSKASSLVKSNTIGSVAAIPNEDFTTNLKATPITARIPQIALTKPDSLIKAYKISVSNPKA